MAGDSNGLPQGIGERKANYLKSNKECNGSIRYQMGGREFLDLSPKRVKQTSFPDIAQPTMRNHQDEADGHSTVNRAGPRLPLATGAEGPVTAL